MPTSYHGRLARVGAKRDTRARRPRYVNMRLMIIHPCIGRRAGDTRYVRTWQMEPLPAATLAGLTPPGVTVSFYDDRMERIPFDAQVIFSDPGGTFNVDTAWWHSSGAGPLVWMRKVSGSTISKLFIERV